MQTCHRHICERRTARSASARLPAEEGAVVLQALEAVMDAQRHAETDEADEDVTAETLAANADGRSELDCGLIQHREKQTPLVEGPT